MSGMAAVRGQVLVCVCWLGVQVSVDVASFQYNCCIKEGYLLCGGFCSEFYGRMKRIDLFQEGRQ